MFPFKGEEEVYVKVSFKIGGKKLITERWKEEGEKKQRKNNIF